MDEVRGVGWLTKEPYELYGDEPMGPHNDGNRHLCMS